jgi:phospholipid transport system substrate-binding protein
MKTWLHCVLLTFAFTLGSASADHFHADDPVTLMDEVAGFIFSDVAENLEHYTANHEALHAMVRKELIPVLDVEYSARLILGRAGRGLPEEKVDEFAKVMTDLLVNRYSKGLLHFSSEIRLRVLPQRGELNEKLTRVRTRVQLPNGGEAPVDYAFRKTADGWKAFDVVVEGISYVTTYRNQIMPDVQANGIDSVIARLSSGQLELAD